MKVLELRYIVDLSVNNNPLQQITLLYQHPSSSYVNSKNSPGHHLCCADRDNAGKWLFLDIIEDDLEQTNLGHFFASQSPEFFGRHL